MTTPEIDPAATAAKLAGLRRRFIGLMIVQGALFLAAAGFAVAYFALHRAWGLPAFAVALGLALIAQVSFIWVFKSSQG
jgi:hypothetical protein